MERQPLISVIIPVHNAAQYLDRCLAAVKRSSYHLYEIIVVDDGSTDATAEVARRNGAFVFKMPTQSGPAAARNYGAEQAKGDIFLFIDSDVLVQEESIARVARDFVEYPDIGALFGSYDDKPAEKNFISQYKNLVHHFVHQISREEAVTFWAGCGAVRKEVFFAACGFDAKRYSCPCIEDIELGYRMKRMGYRILLDKDLQVKHLKEWRLKSLLAADIFSRAIPWTKLILESQEMVSDLNLQASQKISAGLVGLAVATLPLSFLIPELSYFILFSIACIFMLNRKLFNFFVKTKGIKFAFLAFAMQLLYYFYSGVTFTFCWIHHNIKSTTK